MPRPLVIDASVAAKWLLRDEEQIDIADRLLDLSDAGALTLVAPQQLEVEVVAAVRKAVLMRRLSPADSRRRVDEWLEQAPVRFTWFANGLLLSGALDRALRTSTTLFDALYLELADLLGIECVVADERLLRSSAAALEFVRPLSAFAEGQ